MINTAEDVGCVSLSKSTDLDVVKVDLCQAAVVAMDPLQGFLHVGGVRWLIGKDLERIWFHHT